MTAQSSSKSCFGTYLKYRLGEMKINFVMCCILNVLGLPLYSIAASVGFGGGVSEFALTARVFSTLCVISLPLIAIFNAIASFDYYHKKDLTDTIGALPLTHRERFFADLLAGLSVNVAPIIPCGIICAIVMGTAEGKLRAIYPDGGEVSLKMAGIGITIVFIMLLIVIFAYLFAVLTSVCCGKVFHSAIFSVIGMVILPLLFGGLARCFAIGIIGIDSSEYFRRAVTFFPPAGLLVELLDEMELVFTNDPVSRAGWLVGVVDPAHILVYVILAAGLVLSAYLLSKRRLAENTGSAFAIKPMFLVLSGGITAACTIAMLAAAYDEVDYYLVVAAVTGIVVCIVTVLLCPQRQKKFLRSVIVGAASVAVMIGAWGLIYKTGSFGARYYPENADKIESIEIDITYTITDKKDIETYLSLLNERLHDNPKNMDGASRYRSGGFYVQVKQTNGKTTARNYAYENLGRQIFGSTDGYVDYFFDELESISDSWSAVLKNDYSSFSNVAISSEKTAELIKILREEAAEKHDPNGNKFAIIVFRGHGDRTFIIEDSFTKTIAFLTDTEDDPANDPASNYLSVSYRISNGAWEMFTVHIPFKDKDNAKVQELAALLEDCNDEAILPEFRIETHYITGFTGVTEKNKERVLELMKEIALELIDD